MKQTAAYSPATRRLIWAARVLCILLALFLSIFSLDAFDEKASVWRNVFAFFMHQMPVWIILITLAVSWRFEWVGSLVLTIMGVLYIIWAWGRFPISVYFLIAGPVFLTGILFIIAWQMKRRRWPAHA